MTNLIEVKYLEKSYQKKQVIHDISFSIRKGEILCFLGPNGAAKSTTINILCGALSYDQELNLVEKPSFFTSKYRLKKDRCLFNFHPFG